MTGTISDPAALIAAVIRAGRAFLDREDDDDEGQGYDAAIIGELPPPSITQDIYLVDLMRSAYCIMDDDHPDKEPLLHAELMLENRIFLGDPVELYEIRRKADFIVRAARERYAHDDPFLAASEWMAEFCRAESKRRIHLPAAA